jgi:hypothetical protein
MMATGLPSRRLRQQVRPWPPALSRFAQRKGGRSHRPGPSHGLTTPGLMIQLDRGIRKGVKGARGAARLARSQLHILTPFTDH